MSKVQEASSILRVGFVLSKRPHFHRAYLVIVCNQKLKAVRRVELISQCSKLVHNWVEKARPIGSYNILRVLMTFAARYSCNIEILGVLNATFFFIPKIIRGAIAPQLPTTL